MAQAATLHDVPSTRQRGQCETVRHRLPERREIGSEPVELLSAAKVEAESRDHFVENEECAVRGAQLVHAPEEVVLGLLRRRCLHDETRNAAGMPVEHGLDAGEIVVVKPVGELSDRLGNPTGHRRSRDEPVVDREERMLGTDRDDVATGKRAG